MHTIVRTILFRIVSTYPTTPMRVQTSNFSLHGKFMRMARFIQTFALKNDHIAEIGGKLESKDNPIPMKLRPLTSPKKPTQPMPREILLKLRPISLTRLFWRMKHRNRHLLNRKPHNGSWSFCCKTISASPALKRRFNQRESI